jgi:hypothetical protein
VTESRPPRLARWLLRRQPLGPRRSEVEGDLLELFESRVRTHGLLYAKRRYYADVASLWIARGMTFGTRNASGVARSQTNSSQVWQFSLKEIAQDLSYAARLLRRSSGVVAVTIGGLGIAIAVSTSVFSLVNAAAIRSSGIERPSIAVRVTRAHERGIGTGWPYSLYQQLRGGAKICSWRRS